MNLSAAFLSMIDSPLSQSRPQVHNVHVHKPWKTIAGFAFLGLAIAALCYVGAAFYDYTKPMSGLGLTVWALSILLCPAQLVFAYCIDCEVIGSGGFIMYSIIGVLNMGIYAVVGTIVAALRNGKNSSATGK